MAAAGHRSGIFAVENLLLLSTLGSTFGQRLLGLRLASVTGGRASVLQILVRTVLLCLAVPALDLGPRPTGSARQGRADGADPPVSTSDTDVLADVALVTCADERYADPEVEIVAAGLRRRGLTVDVVAWDAERDWAAYLLVVVRSTWDYFDRLPEFVEWVTRVDRLTRLVNPADVIRWNTHKGYLGELASRGVSTVPMRLIPGTSTDVADQVRECPWDDIVLKLAVDGGARTLWRGRRDDAGMSRAAERLADRGDVVVQPFVPAIADGERSLVFLGGRLSHAVRKVPAAGDYRSQHFLGGTELPHEADTAELQVALSADGCGARPADLRPRRPRRLRGRALPHGAGGDRAGPVLPRVSGAGRPVRRGRARGAGARGIRLGLTGPDRSDRSDRSVTTELTGVSC